MNRPGSFDWYQLSKLNQQNPNVQAFSQLIRNARFGQQLSRVPVSLRQKLLIMFQRSSQVLKKQYFVQKQTVQQLQITKRAVNSNIIGLKQQLDNSIQKINSSKILIEQKKRFLQKLKQKIKKKQNEKQKPAQIYFCPFCTRQDFKTRNQFSFHMIKQHAKNVNQGSNQSEGASSQQTIPTQVKDLILSLKDKQIQLMQMMLNKKKQIQTMELQQMYEHQIRKIKTQANFMERKSINTTEFGKKIKSQQYYAGVQDQSEQLKGQSQYLFYQPQKINRGIFQQQLQAQRKIQQKDHYQGRSDYYQDSHQQPYKYHSQYTEQPKIFQPKADYYNIFNDQVTLSQVQSSLSPQKINQFHPTRPNLRQLQTHELKKTTQNINNQPIPLIQEIIPAPQTPTLTTNQNNFNFSTPSAPFIQYNNPIYKQNNQNNNMSNTQQVETNNRQKQLFNDSLIKSQNKRHQSVYLQSKSKSIISNVSEGHIFNSGPLMDDDGDGSDYEDYFGKNNNKLTENQDEVADEQIRVVNPKNTYKNFTKLQKSTPQIIIPPKQQIIKPVPNIQISNSKHSQQYNSNNQSNVLLQYSKDKSFLDISRSHSKSKSSDMIQLSNSFSKRALQSSKNNDDTINLSDLKLSKLQKQRQMRKQNKILELNQSQYQKNVQYLPTYKNQQSSSYQSNPQILAQFKIQQIFPAENIKMAIRKTQKPAPNPIINELRYKKPQNIDLIKTNPGVLEQFLFKQQ